MKFRLLRGVHSHDRTYYPGDIIETTIDLAARFGREKFERIHEDQPAPSAETTYAKLAAMTIAELRQYATENGLDLGTARTKEQILQAINLAPVSNAGE